MYLTSSWPTGTLTTLLTISIPFTSIGVDVRLPLQSARARTHMVDAWKLCLCFGLATFNPLNATPFNSFSIRYHNLSISTFVVFISYVHFGWLNKIFTIFQIITVYTPSYQYMYSFVYIWLCGVDLWRIECKQSLGIDSFNMVIIWNR